MTDDRRVFLGIIAFSVLIMALVQVGAIYAGIRLAQARRSDLAVQLDQDIKPLIANLTALTGEAARAAALAAKQVDGWIACSASWSSASIPTLAAAQDFVTGPARQGMASWPASRRSSTRFAASGKPSRRRARQRGRSWTRKNRFSSADDAPTVLNGGMKFTPSAGSCRSRSAPCSRRPQLPRKPNRPRTGQGAGAAIGHQEARKHCGADA